MDLPLAEMAATVFAVAALTRFVRQASAMAPLRQAAGARSAFLRKLLACPHCLSFWVGLGAGLLWWGLGGLTALQTAALVFLSWRLSYYMNRALDDRLAQKAAPTGHSPCHVCGRAYGGDFIIRRQLQFCSQACWFRHLKGELAPTRAQPLFDQNDAFVRQEIYPMSYTDITPAEAQKLLDSDEDYVYVDVRSIPEFDNGHPKGAFNVPIMHRQPMGMVPNPDFATVMGNRFPREAKLLIGCQSGARSQRAAEALVAAGYTDVRNVKGGFGGTRDQSGQVIEQGWAQLGLPVSTEPEEGKSYADLGGAPR